MNFFKAKLANMFKYLRLSHYTSPESVPVVSLKGMIYMQIAMFVFIILVALSQGAVETI